MRARGLPADVLADDDDVGEMNWYKSVLTDYRHPHDVFRIKFRVFRCRVLVLLIPDECMECVGGLFTGTR